MKAITILQPWATLIALGAKGVEIRPRRTHWLGELAIHASKSLDGIRHWVYRDLDIAGYQVLTDHRLLDAAGEEHPLPLGGIVAIAWLADCRTTGRLRIELTEQPELELGDYSGDRWGWILRYVQKLDPPIPAHGHAGLWHIELPYDLPRCHWKPYPHELPIAENTTNETILSVCPLRRVGADR